MNFIAQVEDHLRDLGAEARKKHPGVKEASERAILELRTLQNTYVSAVRKASHSPTEQHPTTSIFRSQDILRPFLLAANYPNASPKLLDISFRAMKLLIEGDAICPGDGIHLVRVWTIQANVFVNSIKQQQHHGKSSSSSSSSTMMSQPSSQSSSSSSWFGGFSLTGSSSKDSGTDDSSSGDHSVPSAMSSSSGVSGSSSYGKHHNSKEYELLAVEILGCLIMLLELRDLEVSDEQWSSSVALCCILLNAVSLSPAKGGGSSSGGGKHHGSSGGSSKSGSNSGSGSIGGNTTHALVPQAAKSTLQSVITLLYERCGSDSIALHTWKDLLILITTATSSSMPQQDATTSFSFKGAFSHCTVKGPLPPPKDLCLDILHQVFNQRPELFVPLTNSDKQNDEVDEQLCDVFPETVNGLVHLVQCNENSFVTVWKSLHLLKLMVLTQHTKWIQVCQNLVIQLTYTITKTTEACRNNHDFEDGYVYTVDNTTDVALVNEIVSTREDKNPNSRQQNHQQQQRRQQQLQKSSSTSASHKQMQTLLRQLSSTVLIDNSLLWKASLVLEILYEILSQKTSSELILKPIFNYEKKDKSGKSTSASSSTPSSSLLSIITEAISDFATILASCRENMIHIVAMSKLSSGLVIKNKIRKSMNDKTVITNSNIIVDPTIFQRAEDIVKSIESGILSINEIGRGGSSSKGTKGFKSTDHNFPPCPIGESVWIAFNCILLLSQSLSTIDNKELIESAFPPSLAVLQHYLKRFPGSSDVIQSTLAGYTYLADVAVPAKYNSTAVGIGNGNSLQRKVIMTSLCKLSLPMWGKHDPTCQLQDHNVKALICLFNVIHKNYDFILSEWQIVLWTLEELSILSIASHNLSDESYQAAVNVAAAFIRIPSFSACLSTKSLECFVEALADISKSTAGNRGRLESSDSIKDRGRLESSDSISLGSSNTSDKQLPELLNSLDADTSVISSKKETNAAISSVAATTSAAAVSSTSSLGGRIMGLAGRAISLGAGVATTVSSSTTALDSVSGDPQSTNGKLDDSYVSVEQRTKNIYFEDYRRAFVKRMSSSKRSTDTNIYGQLPFSVVALTDVVMSNAFRFENCGAFMSKHLCSLIATSSSDTRQYTMDILAMLIMSELSDENTIPSPSTGPQQIINDENNLRKGLYFSTTAVPASSQSNHGEVGSELKSNEVLVAPLCETIRIADRDDVAESGVSALHRILEGIGHNLVGDVWTVIIDAISSLSGDPSKQGVVDRTTPNWSTCCMVAFRCLKLIVDDFLDQLPSPSESSSTGARGSLLDCCSSFGSSRHDVNTSLTAIGMLWTIADQDPDPRSIDFAFSKMVFLSSDVRTEVRNCSVNTLFSCLVGRGQKYSETQWRDIIFQTIFGVFDRVSSRGEETEDLGCTGPATDNDESKSRYKVKLHHSRDSIGKQWAMTEVYVLRGLGRVLRGFFPKLLSTTDGAKNDGDKANGGNANPWFEEAWTRILGYALNAAKQNGGRDTLDLRKAGIDLLAMCCQLSCEAGNSAAITPARVGTNMEVVNGALRSVRDANSKTLEQTDANSNVSEEVGKWRRQFFLQAFGELEEYRQYLEEYVEEEDDKSAYVESVLLQVLHKLATELAKIYECCKDRELSPDNSEDLEDRFVQLVATVAKNAGGEPGSRYLTQAQRASFDLLRKMASNSSSAALKILATLAGQYFFCESGNTESSPDLMGSEAAKVVSDEVTSDSLTIEAKIEVLCRVLSVYAAEGDNESFKVGATNEERRSYDLLVPVVQGGLQSAANLEKRGNSNNGDEQDVISPPQKHVDKELINFMWDRVFCMLTHMLQPAHITTCALSAELTTNILDLQKAALLHVPERFYDELCTILSSGASNAMDVMIRDIERMSGDLSATEELKIFKSCYFGLCRLKPKCDTLRELTVEALNDALELIDNNEEGLLAEAKTKLGTDVALGVCKAIKQHANTTESLVIAVFGQFCKLISVDHIKVRKEASNILGSINLPQVLEASRLRYEDAENRVQELEQQNEELTIAVEELQDENESLTQQVAVFSASSALS